MPVLDFTGRIRLTGAFEACFTVQGEIRDLVDHRTQQLLALLILARFHEKAVIEGSSITVRKDWLAQMLLPDYFTDKNQEPKQARARALNNFGNLYRSSANYLNNKLGSEIVRGFGEKHPGTITFEHRGISVDLYEFLRACDPPADLGRARAHFHGALLEGWTYSWLETSWFRQLREAWLFRCMEALDALQRTEPGSKAGMRELLGLVTHECESLCRYRLEEREDPPKTAGYCRRFLASYPSLDVRCGWVEVASAPPTPSERSSVGDVTPAPVTSGFQTGSVPPPPDLILGRDQAVCELKQRLMPPAEPSAPSARRLAIVRGWPGVGKTTLISMLAHDTELRAAYPDGTLWAALGPDSDPLSVLVNWGRQVGLDRIGRDGEIENARAELNAALQDRRMLLIVDDVWQAEHAEALRVGGSRCAMLITTRERGIGQALSPGEQEVYHLRELTLEAALELLWQLAPSIMALHRKLCVELCQELECLPLALQVAGRLLHQEAQYGLNVGNLLAELKQVARVLEEEAPADRADLISQTTPTVAALLQKSTDRLDPEIRDCFALLGPFVPKPAVFELEALKAMWLMDDPMPVVKTLVDRGLLESAGDGCYQMHALLLAHARSLLGSPMRLSAEK